MQVNGTLSEVNMRSVVKAKVRRTFEGRSLQARGSGPRMRTD